MLRRSLAVLALVAASFTATACSDATTAPASRPSAKAPSYDGFVDSTGYCRGVYVGGMGNKCP